MIWSRAIATAGSVAVTLAFCRMQTVRGHRDPPVLTRLVAPRSALAPPACHYPQIHSSDQLGPACLTDFDASHTLLQSARVRPKNDHPSDYSCDRPNQDRRIEPDRSDDYCQDQGSSGSDCSF